MGTMYCDRNQKYFFQRQRLALNVLPGGRSDGMSCVYPHTHTVEKPVLKNENKNNRLNKDSTYGKENRISYMTHTRPRPRCCFARQRRQPNSSLQSPSARCHTTCVKALYWEYDGIVEPVRSSLILRSRCREKIVDERPDATSSHMSLTCSYS